MLIRMITTGVTALALTAMVAVALARDLADQDRQFVAAAASGGKMEVQLGQFASQNAINDDVKKFGQQMVTDHTRANEQLDRLANDRNIPTPKELSPDDKATVDRLEKLNGAEFDKAYMAQMVDDHKTTIAAFEKEISDGTDGTIKGFATDTLPTLKHHLEMAEDINKKVNGG